MTQNDPAREPGPETGQPLKNNKTTEDLVAVLREAEVRAMADNDTGKGHKATELLLFFLLWAGVAVAGAAAVYIMIESDSNLGLVAAGVISTVVAGIIIAGATGLFSPTLLTGAVLRRASGKGALDAAELASRETLTGLALSDKVLDADPEARLITKRDGVVVYANKSYAELANEAGMLGATGLPPRIDRLFSQQGVQAAKVFRLCRAAKSGAYGEETLEQTIGTQNGGERRRFVVSTSPVEKDEGYAAWKLRELPVEEEEHDILAASFADYVRPVIALEKNGQIAWANAALRDCVGVGRGELRSIEDLVLGETDALVRGLWQVDGGANEALIRRQNGEPVEGVFRAFRRGGIGEGFVCAELCVTENTGEETAPTVSGDLSEAPFGVALIEGELGRDAKLVEANKAFLDAFANAKKGVSLGRIVPEDAIDEIAAEARRKSSSNTLRTVDATVGDGPGARTHAIFARPIRRRRGSYGPRRAFLYTVDVTDRKHMENDYAQDQKLKAIGFIAGEVSHDFNNLLQVILTSTEVLMNSHPAGDPAYGDLVLIRQNAQRAANMTKQLLAYSRKQTLTSKVQSMTDLLLDFSRFLDRAVGEKVKFKLVNGRGLPPVKVDGNQFETAIMNLSINARDAMAPEGGTLTIATRVLEAKDVAAIKNSALDEIDYVVVEVSDTGPGVPPDLRDKIFDPFFTTKDIGKGTGLGLSTVHGIIGQMGGVIDVTNRPEGGATFTIYLPANAGEIEVAAEAEEEELPEANYRDGGRILVVEDEPAVRLVVVKTLEKAGYDVVIADNGIDALELLEADREFDLILSDVMMPSIDGPTMVEQARAEFGIDSAVIFMSGYAESQIRAQLDSIDQSHYLQKPFSMTDINDRVKKALFSRQANARRQSAEATKKAVAV